MPHFGDYVSTFDDYTFRTFGESVVIVLRSPSVYSPGSGTVPETTESVTVRAHPMDFERKSADGSLIDRVDAIAVRAGDLPQAPKTGDRVNRNGVVYTVTRVTEETYDSDLHVYRLELEAM